MAVAVGLLGGIGAGLSGWLAARRGVVAFKKTPPFICRGRACGALPAPAAGPADTGAQTCGLTFTGPYPAVRRDGTVDTLHGRDIPDPYRWLEDPDSEETQAFVKAQNAITEKLLNECPAKEPLKQLMTKVADFERYGCPFKEGDRYYYFHNSGLQNQSVLYSQASLEAPRQLLLDPNTLSEDGTVSLGSTSFSEDGRFMAYTLSSGGSDWTSVHVMEIGPDGEPKPLDDELKLVKFSCLSWTHDHKGFFYNRYDAPETNDDLGTETGANTDQLLCYHVLGTPQSEDVTVLALPETPTWMAGGAVSDDGTLLWISISNGCEPVNKVWLVELTQLGRTADGAIDFAPYDFFKGTPLPFIKLIDTFEGEYSCVSVDGTSIVATTNKGAPRYKVVRVDDYTADKPTWTDVVSQHKKDVLQSASSLQGDLMLLCYLADVASQLQVRARSSGALIQQLEMPFLGSVAGASCSHKSTEIFFKMAGFAQPGAMYRCQASETGGATPELFRSTTVAGFNPDEWVTKQLWATSKDGERIPMFVVHARDLVMDGTAPTLLYGYGGFNISLQPTFSAMRAAFLMGFKGVFVSTNLRGGGEFGIDWRTKGSNAYKQNVFNDFQACAELLISDGYTSPGKITIQGGSNGGTLVAACANQRPDLYACVLAQVGVMDMLRFHKFTIGHAWCTDFGDPERKEDFEWILPYSPLHNVRPPADGGQYPAMLLCSADHDDRVVPLHTFKLLAELQHTLGAPDGPQRNPLVARIEVRAGHGAGKPISKVIDEASETLAFAAKCMNAEFKG